MTYMLCRNRVADFATWKTVFASHAEAHKNAGLELVKVWRDMNEPSNVFFLFEATNMKKAGEFISNREADEAGKASGVLDGEYHFLEDAGRY